MFCRPALHFFLLLLFVFSAGCTPQPEVIKGLSEQAAPNSPDDSESNLGSQAYPLTQDLLTTTSTPSLIAPAEPAGTISSLQLTRPSILYIRDAEVLEQTDLQTPTLLGSLPAGGPVINAIQIGEELLVLREDGLQKIQLPTLTGNFLLRSETRVLFGDLSLFGNTNQVLYTVVVEDPRADFGMSTIFGVYQAGSSTLQPTHSLPQNLRLLGYTPDEAGFYLLPVGQDPEFGNVFLFDLEKDIIAKELPIEGQGFALLAPDNRTLVTIGTRCMDCEHPEGVLQLYDLPSLPLTPPIIHALPFSPSHVSSLTWSPDGSHLYFLLVDGNPWDEPKISFGLWKLDVSTGVISQVAPAERPLMHFQTLSQDGQWLLLEHESTPESILVNLMSGETQVFNRPNAALTVLQR